MKKIFILATAAIVALASCTKSEVVYNKGQQEIGFRQFTGSMTKATNLSALVGGPETMGVFAHISGSSTQPYFLNAKFVKPASSNDWGGDPKRYWPLQDKLDFTIYAPYVDGTTYDASTAALTVPVADNTTAQQDFLYGVERYTNKTKADSPLAVVLKHALSLVSVKISSNTTGVFTVTKVEIIDPIQGGTIKVDYSSTTSVDVTPSSVTGDVTISSTETPLTGTATDFGSKLVFPISPITNAAKLKITYNMESALGLVAEVNLPDSWQTGKHYTYNVTFSATEILLTPTVEEWTTESTTPITVPNA